MDGGVDKSSTLLFEDSKARLVTRVAANIEACASACRQIVRSSKSPDLLSSAAKNFAAQEAAADRSLESVHRLNILATHLELQRQSISASLHETAAVSEQLKQLIQLAEQPDSSE